MKHLAIMAIGIVVASVLLAVGWWFGLQHRLLTEAYAVPMVDKHTTEVAVTFSILRQLDAGQIEDAKQILNSRLYGHILTVDGLMGYTDSRARDTARKIFTTIAEYRVSHPHSYTGTLSRTEAEVDYKIESILHKAKREQAK